MKKIADRVFETNRPHFTSEKVNDILLTRGLQKGPDLLRQGFEALKKVARCEDRLFPPQLEEDRWWMERLLVGEADDLLTYATEAASLAYRYLRKKR